MAKTSSVTGKIFVGLFMVVLFPTGALLLQSYLGAKSGSEEKEEGQKQNQTQNLVVNVHNHPPGSTLLSPPTTPNPPAKSKGDAPKSSGEELDKGPQRPSPSSDLSRDLSGTWSGHWVDSGDGESSQGMLIKERPNGTIVGGWCDGFKIQKGRRVGRDGILFGNEDGSYQVAGRVGGKGTRLLLLYTYTESKPGTALVGIHRLTRNGVDPSPEPAPGGWSGKWSGVYANNLGNVGSESLTLEDSQDGTLSGVGNDASAFTGRINADGSARWEQTLKDNGLYRAEVRREGDVLRTRYTVTYPAGSKLEGYEGVEWFVRGELPPTPPQPTVSNSKATSDPEPVLPPAPVMKAVTLLALDNDPGKFDGQTLTVRGNLSGTLYDGSIHYRLTVQGAHLTADGERIRKKGINFVIQKDQKETLTEGLKEDQFYPVKLTVTIKQLPKGFWIAVVSRVERE